MSASGEYTLIFALESTTRALRHVREVKTGQACGCICPGCAERLEAVNAQAPTYKLRPHFRHLEGQTSADCAARSLANAAEAALLEVQSVQLPPITPLPKTLFDDAPPKAAPTEIERFELVDHSEALLHLPDGRALRVNVIARTTGGKDLEGEFDLSLDLSKKDLANFQNLGDLRRYLTLDSNCWRWCQRQTKPTLLAEAPAPGTPEELPGEFAEPEPLRRLLTPAAQAPRFMPLPPEKPVYAAPAPPSPAAKPIGEWTDRCQYLDGTVLLFHRQRWPNGVMTEKIERLSKDDADRLI